MTSGIDVGSVASSFVSGALIISVVILIIGIFVLLFISGALKGRKYKVSMWCPRANGTYEEIFARANHIPGDKCEVYFAPFDVIKVIAFKGECINPGNRVHGYMNGRDDVTWIPASNIKIDTTSIRLEPTLDPGMKVTTLNTIIAQFERYKVQDTWKQYMPLMSIAVAAIILILPFMLGMGAITDKLNAVAQAINANTNSQCTAQLISYLNQSIHSAATTNVRPPGAPLG